jgi:hypothetical protein
MDIFELQEQIGELEDLVADLTDIDGLMKDDGAYAAVEHIQKAIVLLEKVELPGPPGHLYLVEKEFFEGVVEGKCTCENARGGWVVEWEGRFFGLKPSTQIQKDIWLGTDGASTDMLRWLCFGCGELQMP